MIKSFLSAVLVGIFCASVKANTTGFVGNGGEGVEFEGRFSVRDLFGFGLQLDPYFGSGVDPQLPSIPHFTFSVPEQLLLKKLTDINYAAPGLGDYLLASMRFYSWTLEDFALTPILDPTDPIALPKDAQVVQIANRLGSIIRIHAGSWKRLNDENKVALLIHEAVFSLMAITPLEGGYVQSAKKTRELTASFFKKDLATIDPGKNYQTLAKSLNLPDIALPANVIRKAASWRIRLMKFSPDAGSGQDQLLKQFDIPITSGTDLSLLTLQLKNICDELEKQKIKSPSSSFSFSERYTTKNVGVTAQQYTVANSSERQTYISIEAGLGELHDTSYEYENSLHCESALALRLKWVALDLW